MKWILLVVEEHRRREAQCTNVESQSEIETQIETQTEHRMRKSIRNDIQMETLTHIELPSESVPLPEFWCGCVWWWFPSESVGDESCHYLSLGVGASGGGFQVNPCVMSLAMALDTARA